MDNRNQKKILALLPGACEEFSDCPPLGLDVLYRDGQVAAEIRKAESDSRRRVPVGSLYEMAAWRCARKWAERSRFLAPSVAMEELFAAGLVSLKVWYVVRGEMERPMLVRDTPGIFMKNFDTGEVFDTTIIPTGEMKREWKTLQPAPCVFVLKRWEDVLKTLLEPVPDMLKESYSNDVECNNKVEYMGGASVCVFRLGFRLTPEGEAFLEGETEREKKECTDKPGVASVVTEDGKKTKRRVGQKIGEQKRLEIAAFAGKNPNLTNADIAKHFDVSVYALSRKSLKELIEAARVGRLGKKPSGWDEMD